MDHILMKNASEDLAKEWLLDFMNEMDEIEKFYNNKIEEIADRFINLQAKYLKKLDNDEE